MVRTELLRWCILEKSAQLQSGGTTAEEAPYSEAASDPHWACGSGRGAGGCWERSGRAGSMSPVLSQNPSCCGWEVLMLRVPSTQNKRNHLVDILSGETLASVIAQAQERRGCCVWQSNSLEVLA